jgi:hypothetical protein
VQFALKVPGVTSIAIHSSNPEQVKVNRELAADSLPEEFWAALRERDLIGFDPLALVQPEEIKPRLINKHNSIR